MATNDSQNDEPKGAVGSLAMAHTLALATLIDILVRDKVLDLSEITRAYSKLAADLRKNKKLGASGPLSLEKIVELLNTSRGAQGRA
jgi:hypothetical protein